MTLKWITMFFMLIVTYYTCSYGLWALKKGHRGGIGVFILAAFVLALSIYSLFLG
jgi:hypothetical protein